VGFLLINISNLTLVIVLHFCIPIIVFSPGITTQSGRAIVLVSLIGISSIDEIWKARVAHVLMEALNQRLSRLQLGSLAGASCSLMKYHRVEP